MLTVDYEAAMNKIIAVVAVGALLTNGGNVAHACAREICGVRQVNMAISLAFLAPTLVKAAVEGRLPRGIGIERLRDPPTEWSRQFEALGLNPE
jgi:site-specific DNA recombinase